MDGLQQCQMHDSSPSVLTLVNICVFFFSFGLVNIFPLRSGPLLTLVHKGDPWADRDSDELMHFLLSSASRS